MPNYYCDYCKSYLTHDTMSVRKSHLMGKNHIRYYYSYYENIAKKQGNLVTGETEHEVDLEYLNRNAPGSVWRDNQQNHENHPCPPPKNIGELPNPPPSALKNEEEYQESINIFIKNINQLKKTSANFRP